jgi:hypothetical protein
MASYQEVDQYWSIASTTHDHNTTVTTELDGGPDRFADRHVIDSCGIPLRRGAVPLAHRVGLKRLAAAALLASGLCMAVIGLGAAITNADPAGDPGCESPKADAARCPKPTGGGPSPVAGTGPAAGGPATDDWNAG